MTDSTATEDTLGGGAALPASIGDYGPYTEALTQLIAAHEECPSAATSEEEQAAHYKAGWSAAEASWRTLTAAVDTYCARRIREALEATA